LAMSLETPILIRTLQRKLYRKAKQEPDVRFYLLYDKIYREDILSHAYARVKANKGAAGVDGQTFEAIESQGLEKWLEGIRKDLRDKTYKPLLWRRRPASRQRVKNALVFWVTRSGHIATSRMGIGIWEPAHRRRVGSASSGKWETY
jgi:hypothetical protein